MKKYNYKINGVPYEVSIESLTDGAAQVVVNGTSYAVELEQKSSSKPVVPQGARVAQPVVSAPTASAPRPAARPAGGSGAVVSPLPGVILRIMVKEGDAVKAGQTLLCLEAMKMENNVDADRDGTVTSVAVAVGDSVMEGDTLVTIGA